MNNRFTWAFQIVCADEKGNSFVKLIEWDKSLEENYDR